MINVLVSACLLGSNCKYNGGNNLNKEVKKFINKVNFLPVCPEQLGGLDTPRKPCEIVNNKVLDEDGNDKTEAYLKGAYDTLVIGKLYDCKYAILKQRSPSCGHGMIYDGSFTGKLKQGSGITAKLLMDNNIKVFSEDELKQFSDTLISEHI